MANIRAKNTKPEILLRAALFKKGLRYRIHVKDLPGKPDIIFKKYKLAIFVNGCFWHMHENCREGRIPNSRIEYWQPKLIKNVQRDLENQKKLLANGWNVIVVWECEIEKNVEQAANNIVDAMRK